MAREEQNKGEARGFAGLDTLLSNVDMTPPPAATPETKGALSTSPKPRTSQQQEEKQSEGEGKGFTGLDTLLSNVDTKPTPAPAPASANNQETKGAPVASPSASPKPQTRPQPYQAPSQPPSDPPKDKWAFLGIAAFIGLVWFIIEAVKPPSSPTSAYSPPPPKTAPSYPAHPPVQNQNSSHPVHKKPHRPIEEKPSKGRNNNLSYAQIYYCLAEKIRLDAAENIIKKLNESDVDRFNILLDDYNSRCMLSGLISESDALVYAKQNIQLYYQEIYEEGRRRFPLPSRPSLSSSESPSQLQIQIQKPPSLQENNIPTLPQNNLTSPHSFSEENDPQIIRKENVLVRSIQSRLNQIGYYSGVEDGLLGRKTRAAISEFQKDHKLPIDGEATINLLNLLNQYEKRHQITVNPQIKHEEAHGVDTLSQDISPEEKCAGFSFHLECKSILRFAGKSDYDRCLSLQYQKCVEKFK